MAEVVVKGMGCAHCKQVVAKTVADLPGITDVSVDLDSGRAEWHGEEGPEAVKAVKEALLEIGFETV